MQYLRTSLDEPVQFISSGQFLSDTPWSHSRRTIDSYELMIGYRKCLYMTQDQTDYAVHPGQVLLLQPGRVHEGTRLCEPGISFFWLHFHLPGACQWIGQEEMEREVVQLRKQNASRQQKHLYIPAFFTPDSVERINILFQQLQHVVNANYYTFNSAHYLVTSLLIELSEQTVTQCYLSGQKSDGDRTIAEMMEWIRLHSLDPISAADIAEQFRYNRDYLSRMFKKRTGVHLQEYINLVKLKKAKDLLAHSRISVKEVADTVGVSDEKYFMRMFRQYERMTPTEYRKAYYETHMNNQ